jgi:PAS domain S-box-containing protein
MFTGRTPKLQFISTDPKRAKPKMREADERARNAIDGIPVQIWSGTADGLIDFCNEQWRTYTGLNHADLQGDKWQRILHPEDRERVLAAWSHAVATGARYEQEERHQAADGSYRWFLVRAVPLRNAHGQIERWFGANTDITDRRVAEDARRRSEKALGQSLDRLRALTGRLMSAQDEERRRIAQLLHETTAQNLAGLKMLLTRLHRTSTSLTEEDRAVIDESAGLANRMMSEIRTLSYLLHPPFLDETGLLSAIHWYTDGFTKRSGIQVNLDLDPTLARLPREVEVTLFRVVQESLINVHRHSESRTAHIRLHVRGGLLALEIEDDGKGMSAETVTSFNSEGSTLGVGLAGMRERMKQLGGVVEIDSTEQGTTLRAILPFHRP